mmetsp:Transcript_46533/g.137540  ORF Transcript_46533/g.137540 Transcript_46533/m.137540 type:complete len:237 (-) Transcript_46533:558-1268(-)
MRGHPASAGKRTRTALSALSVDRESLSDRGEVGEGVVRNHRRPRLRSLRVGGPEPFLGVRWRFGDVLKLGVRATFELRPRRLFDVDRELLSGGHGGRIGFGCLRLSRCLRVTSRRDRRRHSICPCICLRRAGFRRLDAGVRLLCASLGGIRAGLGGFRTSGRSIRTGLCVFHTSLCGLGTGDRLLHLCSPCSILFRFSTLFGDSWSCRGAFAFAAEVAEVERDTLALCGCLVGRCG